VILSSTPLDKNDLSKGITFTVLNISERKRTEDELRETHRSINTLISNLQGLFTDVKMINSIQWSSLVKE